MRLHEAIRLQIARLAVGPSTVRRQGVAGLVDRLRTELGRLPLEAFACGDGASFERALNRWTRKIEANLPRRARSWGLARKCLNIYVRDCYYNTYLNEQFGSSVSEEWFEIPLDSITGRYLRDQDHSLPRWGGVRHLDPDDSALFQQAAARLAASWGVARVHLDTYIWVQAR